MLSREEARDIFHYDADTGIFRWRKKIANKVVVGKVAGTKKGGAYIDIVAYGRHYLAHRLAWLYVHGEYPPEIIDHIDGDGLNNRITNLRSATQGQNVRNCRLDRRNKIGLKGVRLGRKGRGWQARITVNYRQIHLGTFPDKESAYAAYSTAALQHFGEYARV